MPNRYTGASDHRYGFQGQEQDNEIKGQGNSVNYKYRMHDARIGRFFAADPLERYYSWNSPYAFSENQVIRFVELEGLEKADPAMFKVAQEFITSYETRMALPKDNPMYLDGTTKINGLDLNTLITDLRSLVADASSAEEASSQSLGYFCGKTAVEGVSIQYNPVGYVSYVMELALNGESSYGDNSPTTTLDPSLKSGLSGYTDHLSSEIFGSSLDYSTRSQSGLRNTFPGKLSAPDEPGNSHPYEMNRILDYVGMKSQKSEIYFSTNSRDIPKLQNARHILRGRKGVKTEEKDKESQ